MRYEADTHSHTIASGHAYNTIMEMAQAARDKGLKMLGITDQTHGVPEAAPEAYFRNYKIIPREIFGVRLLMGAEVNILNDGTIDMSEKCLRRMDIVIASLHGQCYKNAGLEGNTETVLKVIENPFVDILGHPDDSHLPLDYERIAAKAAETGTIIELNEYSHVQTGLRYDCRENQLAWLKYCKAMRVPVAIGSDAHFMNRVGEHSGVESVLIEADFPMDLVMNTDAEKLAAYLKARKERLPQ